MPEDPLLFEEDPASGKVQPVCGWRLDYESGLAKELYEVPLSEAYSGWAFARVVCDVGGRSRWRALLVGVVEVGEEGPPRVFIHPGWKYRLPGRSSLVSSVVGLFVAGSLEQIQQAPRPKRGRALGMLARSHRFQSSSLKTSEDLGSTSKLSSYVTSKANSRSEVGETTLETSEMKTTLETCEDENYTRNE